MNNHGIILDEVDFMKEILVDENGYNQFLEELEKLKQQSLLISSAGSEAYQDAVGDGWHDNFAFEESMRQSRNIATRIENMLKTKQYLKVIKRETKGNNIINIGDVLKVKIFYSDDDIEDAIIKLTGNFIPIIENENDIQEITLNSPLGKALYLKNIKDNNINYDVNDNKIKITVIEKI